MTDFTPLPRVTQARTYRLGVTSYVYPADILTNVERVAPVVDDIEIVFFESHDASNFPSLDTIEKLRMIAARHDLTYTIHFPTDRALGSPDPAEREAFLASVLHIIELCRPLTPHGWILHVEGIRANADATRLRAWQRDTAPLLGIIAGMLDHPARLCLENIDYPFDWCEPLLNNLPFAPGVCLDLGHLWQANADWKAAVQRWLPRTRIVHLYGNDQTSRHYSLQRTPIPLVQEVLATLAGYTGVLTLETFGYDDTATSLHRLSECL